MNSCAIYGCTNNTSTVDPTIEFYSFPKHPLVAQQWVAACWRPEPVDVANAQICSIHFNDSCFVKQYQLDYLGNYTKVLKYDAIPNLYLPDAQQSILLSASEHPISVTTTNPINPAELLLYEVEAVPFPAYDTVITLTTDQIVDMAIRKNLDNVNDEPKCETSKRQLDIIKNANIILKRNCDEHKVAVNQLRESIKTKRQEIQSLNKEIKKILHRIDVLRINDMTLARQKYILSKVFSESQIKILSGKKKIYWSDDDMAISYTIRHISNKRCYLYLSKKLNFPLPALSSIKRWSTVKKNGSSEGDGKEEESKFTTDDSL